MENDNTGNGASHMGGSDAGKKEFMISIIGSVLGLICCPCLFSVVGIIFGNMAKKKGHPNGQLALILGIVSLVLGIGVGWFVNMNNPMVQGMLNGGR